MSKFDVSNRLMEHFGFDWDGSHVHDKNLKNFISEGMTSAVVEFMDEFDQPVGSPVEVNIGYLGDGMIGNTGNVCLENSTGVGWKVHGVRVSYVTLDAKVGLWSAKLTADLFVRTGDVINLPARGLIVRG